MSDVPKTSEQLKSKPPMPEYFRFDERKRQEFLSQVGTFTDEQRIIFNKLCDLWEPEISFSKAAVKIGISYESNAFKNLMVRLMGGHCGLLKMIFRNGQVEPHQVILTDRQSIRFYYHLVESEYAKNLVADTTPYVNLKTLSEAGFAVPVDFLEVMLPENFSETFSSANADRIRIFKVEGIGQSGILSTPGTVGLIVRVAKFKLRANFNNTGLVSSLSKMTGKKVSDLERQIKTEDLNYWNELTQKIVEAKEDLLLIHKNLSKSIFISSQIIQNYAKNEITASELKRREEAEKKESMQLLCEKIGKKENFLLSQKELNDLIEPHLKRWPDFKEQFYDSYVKMTAGTGLPLIVFTGKHYIHRDHVYPFFKQELKETAGDLHEYYCDLMERMIKTRNRDKIMAFTSRDTFKHDIRAHIREESSFLDCMLNKPKILSEAIIHYGRTQLKIKTIDKMKELLIRYFHEGVIQFRDIDFLMNLYLQDIFERAYQRLSLWKRVVLKLSGRYESYANAYYGLSQAAASSKVSAAAREKEPAVSGARVIGSENSGYYRKKNPDQGAYYERRKRSSPQYQTVSHRKKRAEKPPSKYSRKQIDQAWDEFDEAFEKLKQKKPNPPPNS